MAAIVEVASKIRPLKGAIIRRFPAASTNVTVGAAVYVTTAGACEVAENGDTVAKVQARGVVVAIGTQGATTAAVGDQCDVVVFGAVELGVGSNTEGAVVYVGVAAGTMDQTITAVSGDFPFVIGWMESDTVLFVNPQVTIPTAI